MAYSADTFVADEQPTTAKWNKLWNNDAAFNDGSGFNVTNNQPIGFKDSGGTTQDGIKVDTSNRVIVGDADLKGGFFVNGCYLASGQNADSGTATSVANSSATNYPFNEAGEELYDPLGMHSTSSNPERITAQVAGVYRFFANVYWPDNITGRFIADVFKNGATNVGAARGAQDGDGRRGHSVIGVVRLAATDYLYLAVFQSTGSAATPLAVSFGAELIGV